MSDTNKSQLTLIKAFDEISDLHNRMRKGEINVTELVDATKRFVELNEYCESQLRSIEDDLKQLIPPLVSATED